MPRTSSTSSTNFRDSFGRPISSNQEYGRQRRESSPVSPISPIRAQRDSSAGGSLFITNPSASMRRQHGRTQSAQNGLDAIPDDQGPPPPDYNTAIASPVDQNSPQGRTNSASGITPSASLSQPSRSSEGRRRTSLSGIRNTLRDSFRATLPSVPSSTQIASTPVPDQSPPSTNQTSQTPQTRARRQSAEDPLASLSRYDVVFLVDDSGSMDILWDDVRQSLIGVVERAVRYDSDGVDIHFFNSEVKLENCSQTSEVASLFRSLAPSGSTPTGMRLDDLLRPWVESLEDFKAGGSRGEKPKPLLLVVLTDGRADDPDLVKEVLVEMAQRLDEGKWPKFYCGIEFLQIGDDPDAAEFLRELDDDLKDERQVRDIVDTVSWEGRVTSEFLLQALLGSINRRIDEQNTKAHEKTKRK